MQDGTSVSEVGRRLRKAAGEAGLTLRELGERMNVSRPTIYAYASGALKMSDDRLKQAAEITGKPLSYFDPQNLEDLDGTSNAYHSMRLVDAFMSPASPARASEAALDAIGTGQSGEAPAIRAELLRKAGNALALTGDYLSAARHLETASESFKAIGALDKVGACAQTLGFCYISVGHLDKAKECFETSREALPEDQKWKGDISLAALSERIGDFDAAQDRLNGLLDDPRLSEPAMAYVRANYASIVCARGRWKTGLSQSESALDAAFSAGLPDQAAEMMVQCAIALTCLGKLDQATLMVLRAKDVTFTLQDEARSTLTELARAGLLAAFGDDDRARGLLADAYSRAVRGQYRRSESFGLLLEAEFALKRGDFAAALEWGMLARSHGSAHRYVAAQLTGGVFESMALTALGRTSDSRTALANVESWVEVLGSGRPHVLYLEALGRLSLVTDRREEADQAFQAALSMSDREGLSPDAERLMSYLSGLSGDPLTALSSTISTYGQPTGSRTSSAHADDKDWKRFLVSDLGGDSAKTSPRREK
ncbi:MAG: helix-turn-helix domain-containing protein [Armatimonadetes bacterium]|nr:helix-turn-helix domain-containing protein [Armatimonadota bacterium]